MTEKQHKGTKPPVGYRIASMEVLEYSSKHDSDYAPDKQVVFNIAVNYLIALDLSHVLVKATITISMAKDSEPEGSISLVKAVTQIKFDVTNLEHYILGEEVKPPSEFIASIANITVSTSRGVMYAKNFGTQYSGLILPTINTDSLFPSKPFIIKAPPQLQPAAEKTTSTMAKKSKSKKTKTA